MSETGEVQIKRIQLLWEIAVETDLEDVEQIEEKIYEYGSCLEEKDQLGRKMFLRMVYLLQMAKQ